MFLKSIKDFFKNPIVTIPGILFYLLIGGLSFYNLDPATLERLEQAGATGDIESISAEAAAFLSMLLLIFILSLFINPLVQSWSNLMVKDVVLTHEPHFRDNFRNSFRYYWRMFSISIIIGLFFIILFVAFAIACTPLIILAVNGNSSNITIAAILIIIFILLSIFMGISLMPVSTALVFEDLSITGSLSKGFKFGVKNFFPILGSCIPVVIIVLILSIILYNYPHAVNVVNAYLGLFLTVYIMNLYNHKNPPLFEEVSTVSTDSGDNNDSNNVDLNNK